MYDYAVLTWRFGDTAPGAVLAKARAPLLALGWTCHHERPGLEVWAPADQDPQPQVSSGHERVILGRVFEQPERQPGQDMLEAAEMLCRGGWGRYAVVFRGPDGRAAGIFRDPSGAVEALAWTVEGLSVVASDTMALLEAIPPSNLGIDWRLLGWAMVDRIALAGDCPLRGVHAVTPGALRRLEDGVELPVWRPGVFAVRGLTDTDDNRQALASTVDATVGRLAQRGGCVLAELSGGLDSSIVGSALVKAPAVEVAQWVHYFVEDPAGDERTFARAAAERLGVELTEVAKVRQGMGLDRLAQAGRAIRPSGALGDPHYDLDLADRARALGAKQIFSGMGGDTVFLQGGNPYLAFDDYWRRFRWGFGPAYEVARFAKRSVWSVWRAAQKARFFPDPVRHTPETSHLAASAVAFERPAHPWLRDLRDVPPAKRRQLMLLTYQLLVQGRTARGQCAEIVNPLLSQPVMEMTLSLSARALTHGGDDRVMARETFRDRLAPEIYRRRSKGDLSRHYGRETLQDLDALRGLLLDGELINAGLLDPVGLDEMLTPESLIWKGHYRAIMDMVVLEQWARSWRARLSGLTGAVLGNRIVQPA